MVNYHWLIDCMKQNQRLSEEPYKSLELADNQQPFSPVNKQYVLPIKPSFTRNICVCVNDNVNVNFKAWFTRNVFHAVFLTV